MLMHNDAKPDHNPYFIATEENAAEVARLVYQKQLTIQAQGELLPDRIDPRGIHDVLDLACGPGTWALEMATAYPHLHLVGVDLSPTMLRCATLYAQVDALTNVRFVQMDIVCGLAFPDASFDLINADYLQSFLRPTDWLPLLAECRRVLRPGGVLKLGELEGGISTGRATDALYTIWARAMKAAGRTFSCDGQHLGITAMLRPLLLDAG
jgi:ubiquinone/menaquinone biosynthesis C-methylase UbiE